MGAGHEIYSIDAGGCFGSWFGWGESVARRASRVFGLGSNQKERLSRRDIFGSVKVVVGCGNSSLWNVNISKMDKELITEVFRN